MPLVYIYTIFCVCNISGVFARCTKIREKLYKIIITIKKDIGFKQEMVQKAFENSNTAIIQTICVYEVMVRLIDLDPDYGYSNGMILLYPILC